MGVYGKRIGPAYENHRPVPDKWAENTHILAWWTPAHDKAIVRVIEVWRWNWFWKLTDAIVAETPQETIDRWQKTDRLCRRYAWYNVLAKFAQARAQVMGFAARIPLPAQKPCPLCGEPFTEDSLGMPFVERLGPDRPDVCSPCLEQAIFEEETEYKTPDGILRYLRELADIVDRVPSQRFGEGTDDLRDLDPNTRNRVLVHLRGKPTKKSIKNFFPTWFDALVAADLLDDGARKNSRGIQCRAKDGHMCHSLGEKTIDDLLFHMGVEHTREPAYPDSNYRGDFGVGNTIIEYFGLAGNAEYDQKVKTKTAIAKKHKIPLVAIFPKDLVSTKKLRNKLARLVLG